MANTTQNIALVPSTPELSDLHDYWKKLLKLETCVHHIGTVESFNALTQTCEVNINYLKTFLNIDYTGATSITTQTYPIVVGCPAIILGGGSAFLSFPIKKGDECILLFNDRDMDNWFSGSNNSAPATTRLHSFSDAIALIGVRSLPNVLLDYDEDAATIQNGDNYVKIYDDSIEAQVGISSVIIEDGTITVKAGPTGTTLVVDSSGTITITNAMGEFVNALITALQTATAGGFPLIADLTILESFKG